MAYIDGEEILFSAQIGGGAENALLLDTEEKQTVKGDVAFEGEVTVKGRAVNPYPYSKKKDANTAAVRDEYGGLQVAHRVGNLYYAPSIRTVMMAQSFAGVDYFIGGVDTYKYKEGSFQAVGWRGNEYEDGYLTDVPHESGSYWFQKVVNGTDEAKTLHIQNGCTFNSSYNTVDKLVARFTDKVLSVKWDEDMFTLDLEIAPRSAVYIQCKNTSSGYTQISIT